MINFSHFKIGEQLGIPEKIVTLYINVSNNPHWTDPDAISINHRLLRSLGFDAYKALKALKKYGLIVSAVPESDDRKNGIMDYWCDFEKEKIGVAKRYYDTDLGKQVLLMASQMMSKHGIPTEHCKNVNGVLKPFTDAENQKLKKSHAVCSTVIQGDIKECRKLMKSKDKKIAKDARRLYKLMDKDGYIVIYYHRKHGDRHYEIGFGPQTCCKVVRDVVFHGYYQYDLNACFPSILNHFKRGEELSAYVEDKSTYRKTISLETGIPELQVKKVLSAVLFGASTTGNEGTAIERILGKKATIAFFNNERISKLMEEINAAKEVILVERELDLDYIESIVDRFKCKEGGYTKGHSILDKKNLVDYDGNLTVELRVVYSTAICNNDPRVQVFHYLAFKESQVMDALYREGITDLMLHDGFLTRKKLDVEWLNRVAKEASGIDFTFEESLLGK